MEEECKQQRPPQEEQIGQKKRNHNTVVYHVTPIADAAAAGSDRIDVGGRRPQLQYAKLSDSEEEEGDEDECSTPLTPLRTTTAKRATSAGSFLGSCNSSSSGRVAPTALLAMPEFVDLGNGDDDDETGHNHRRQQEEGAMKKEAAAVLTVFQYGPNNNQPPPRRLQQQPHQKEQQSPLTPGYSVDSCRYCVDDSSGSSQPRFFDVTQTHQRIAPKACIDHVEKKKKGIQHQGGGAGHSLSPRYYSQRPGELVRKHHLCEDGEDLGSSSGGYQPEEGTATISLRPPPIRRRRNRRPSSSLSSKKNKKNSSMASSLSGMTSMPKCLRH